MTALLNTLLASLCTALCGTPQEPVPEISSIYPRLETTVKEQENNSCIKVYIYQVG